MVVDWCIVTHYYTESQFSCLLWTAWITLRSSQALTTEYNFSCYSSTQTRFTTSISTLYVGLHAHTFPATLFLTMTANAAMLVWCNQSHLPVTDCTATPTRTYTHSRAHATAPTRSTLIPRSHSCLHRKVEFVSLTKPFKISSPMTACG